MISVVTGPRSLPAEAGSHTNLGPGIRGSGSFRLQAEAPFYGTSVAAGRISAAETGLVSRLASVAKKRMNSARPRAAPMVRPADIQKPPMESSAWERGKPCAPAGVRCKPYAASGLPSEFKNRTAVCGWRFGDRDYGMRQGQTGCRWSGIRWSGIRYQFSDRYRTPDPGPRTTGVCFCA